MVCALAIVPALVIGCAPEPQTQVEVFSSWTTGPEAFGLQKLSHAFELRQPTARVVNAALVSEGTSGSSADLANRLLAGKPPDIFQVSIGAGFTSKWVEAGYMEPLDDLYRRDGLGKFLPPAVMDLVSYQGHPYAVAVDIHQANVLFYNSDVLAANGIDPASLATFPGWQAAAETLAAAGITPLALGNRDPRIGAQLFETVLIGTLGPMGYSGLWTGRTDWGGADVAQALKNFQVLLDFANPDHSALTWDQANQLVIQGRAAMTIMSDWAERDYVAKAFSGFGWTSPPGNAGVFDVFGDAFGLSKGAKNPELAREFLSVLSSKQGQETFDQMQGAICPRTDCDYSSFEPYFRSSAQAWTKDAIVPSVANGAAVSEDWAASFVKIVGGFVNGRDVVETQHALALACTREGICE